jgi:hypothetical protein
MGGSAGASGASGIAGCWRAACDRVEDELIAFVHSQ